METIWITKFWQTLGIYSTQAYRQQDDRFQVGNDIFIGKSWHKSEEAAKEHVKELRDKMVVNLQAKIERLNAMEL